MNKLAIMEGGRFQEVFASLSHHEDITDLGIHGDPADLGSNAQRSQDGHSLPISVPSLPLTTAVVGGVAAVASEQRDRSLGTWVGVLED